MGMWLGQHSRKLRVITCGFVSTTHNPLRTAESIATMDNMLGGRFGFGLVRGYQARWVDNLRIRGDLNAVGPWNRDTPVDRYNREYFEEFVDIVLTALRHDTFRYEGKFWTFPPADFVNPHAHPVYSRYGRGVSEAMRVSEIGSRSRAPPAASPALRSTAASPTRCARRSSGRDTRASPSCSRRTSNSARRSGRPTGRKRPFTGHSVRPGDGGGLGRHHGVRQDRRRGAGPRRGHALVLEPVVGSVRARAAGDARRLPRHPLPADSSRRRAPSPSRSASCSSRKGSHDRGQILSSLELFAEKVIPNFTGAAPEELAAAV